MSLDEGLAKFVGGLYEAVHDREAWRTALGEIVRRTGSRMVIAASVDLRLHEVNGIEFHGSEGSSVDTGIKEYADGMSAHDPSVNWARQHPHAGICDTAAIVPRQNHAENAFMKWKKSRFGTEHWRVFYTEPVDDLSFGLSFHTSGDDGPPKRDLVPLQQLLFENLERALRLAARPPDFAADDSALIAIDKAGRTLSLSQRAEELLGNELLIRDGLLTAVEPETARRLKLAIGAAIDPSRRLLGRALRISRDFSRGDLLVIVSPFSPSLNYLPMPVPAALVRIIELETTPTHLSEHAHLFNLTARETEVATAMLGGHSIESMAATLGMSRNTARNHLQALFHKTRTNRQSDLIRLLDRLGRQ